MVLANEIRILHLRPHKGDDSSLLEGYLAVASLETNPEYEAVSYVWGSTDTLFTIDISGTKIGVTQNLYQLLLRLRLADKSRALWIDQLCINQWDTKEKAEQVRLMRQIYSKCQKCQIWMGDFSEGITQADGEHAVEILEYMAAVFDAGGKEEDIRVPSSLGSAEAFAGPLRALESLGMHTTPWWSRMWTVQEAVLPPQQTILWGSTTFAWKTLTNATKTWVGDMPNLLSERFEAVETLGDFMATAIWVDLAREADDPPQDVITRYRMRRATDPRDKVFALLGLFPDGTLPTVEECDYDTPAKDVFCDLTLSLMVYDESLVPLIMDPRLEVELATPGIPRWALDTGYLSEHGTDWIHLHAWDQYEAHGGRGLDIEQILETRKRSKHTLELKGVFLDTIACVGEVWLCPRPPESDFHKDQCELIREWKLVAEDYIKKITPEPTSFYQPGMSFREAFGRLMLGDILRDDEHLVEGPVDEEDVEEIYKYIETGEESWIHSTIGGMMKNQRLFITRAGFMGIGHMETQAGEEVWAFHGGNFPFTLHRREGGCDDEYNFGGVCYVQGVMSGESFERGEEERTITIF